MKRLLWLGDSYRALMAFPAAARHAAGFELKAVQLGQQPSDFKAMPSIGPGVEEIRIWVESGTYRVVYLARMPEAVYVLHAFSKKTQQTAPKDIGLAKARLKSLLQKGAKRL